MPLVGAWENERYLDYRCLYVSAFLLLENVFPCPPVGLESRPFLLFLVTFYYSSIEKTNLKHISVCTLHPFFLVRAPSNSILPCSFLFLFRVTSNSIPPRSPLLHLRVASNSILPSPQQSRARRISSLAAADDIFLIGGIDKVIKPITEHVR